MPVTKLAHARPPDSKMFRPYIWVSACRAPAKHNMYNTPELGWGHHSCGGVGQIGRYTQSARRISWKTKFPVNAMCKSIAWETSLTPVGNRVLVQDINVKPLQVGAAEVEYKWWMSCNVHPSPEGGTTLTKDHPVNSGFIMLSHRTLHIFNFSQFYWAILEKILF